MILPTCYSCDCTLLKKQDTTPEQRENKKYESKEHIIPNSLGGFLSSNKLLCADCNSKFGEGKKGIDNILFESMIFAKLGEFKKDRGDSKHKIDVKDDNGLNYQIKKGFEWGVKDPTHYIDDEGKLKVYAPNKRILKQYLEGLKKNENLNLNIESSKNSIIPSENNQSPNLNVNWPERTEDFYRAIAKIAINFYLYHDKDINHIQPMISYIKGENELGLRDVNEYQSFVSYHKLEKDEVSHLLYIRGDSKKGLLFCYIELFSCHNFMVILNSDYQGEDFQKYYCYDILKEKELTKELNFTLFKHPFINLPSNFCDFSIEMERKKIDRTSNILSVDTIQIGSWS